MPGSPGGRATLLCPGAWLGRPLGLQACTAQGRAAGSQPGPPSCPPATMLSPRTCPRFLRTSFPPFFSRTQAPSCCPGTGHGTEGTPRVPSRRHVTSQQGQGHGGRLGAGRCSLLGHLAGAAPPPRKEPWAQRAASGGPHYLERRGLGGHVSGRSTRLLHAAGQCRWPRGSLSDTQEHCTLPGGRRRPQDPLGAWLTYIR